MPAWENKEAQLAGSQGWGGRSWHCSLLPACPAGRAKAVWHSTAVPEHISNIQNIVCFPVFSSAKAGYFCNTQCWGKQNYFILSHFLLEIYSVQHSQTSLKICILHSLHPFRSTLIAESYYISTWIVWNIFIDLFDREHLLTLIHNIFMKFLVCLGIRQFQDTTLWFLVPFHPPVPKWNQQIQDTYKWSEKNSLEFFSQLRVLAME